MAGRSSRFAQKGYKVKKYELPTSGDLNLFQQSVSGFSHYFESDEFLFVYQKNYTDSRTLRKWCAQIGLNDTNCHFVGLDTDTLGQAHTVDLGLSYINCSAHEPITIFNIDTIYRKFRKFICKSNYLDVTEMPGDHWSFVKIREDNPMLAERVSEKRRISNLCSIGLYHFHDRDCFRNAYYKTYSGVAYEHYVAPIYNELISQDQEVFVRKINRNRFSFLGTPDEYEDYMSNFHGV